jgi:hypothetical protein
MRVGMGGDNSEEPIEIPSSSEEEEEEEEGEEEGEEEEEEDGDEEGENGDGSLNQVGTFHEAF